MIADSFHIDKRLVLEFFCVFSRFEYALKRAGFAAGNEKRVDPDWECFGRTLRGLSAEALAPVLSCCQYLRRNSPKKQVLREGQLAWSDSRDTSLSEIEQLLVDIRRARNNLFHGGKFPIPDGPVAEVARNEQLLKDSLAALTAILDLPGVDWVKVNFAPGDE